jgi:hypothetical protein
MQFNFFFQQRALIFVGKILVLLVPLGIIKKRKLIKRNSTSLRRASIQGAK